MMRVEAVVVKGFSVHNSSDPIYWYICREHGSYRLAICLSDLCLDFEEICMARMVNAPFGFDLEETENCRLACPCQSCPCLLPARFRLYLQVGMLTAATFSIGCYVRMQLQTSSWDDMPIRHSKAAQERGATLL